MTILDQFKAYIASFKLNQSVDEEYPEIITEHYDDLDNHMYGFKKEPTCFDLNKEVNHQTKLVGIRSDDNFFIEAVLPYKFKDLTVEEIVGILWPNETDFTFNPDSITEEGEE